MGGQTLEATIKSDSSKTPEGLISSPRKLSQKTIKLFHLKNKFENQNIHDDFAAIGNEISKTINDFANTKHSRIRSEVEQMYPNAFPKKRNAPQTDISFKYNNEEYGKIAQQRAQILGMLITKKPSGNILKATIQKSVKPLWTKKGRLKALGLPTTGKIRFVPRKGYDPSNPLPRGPNNGVIDKFGNEWVKGTSRTQGQAFEWDVQLSKTGKQKLGWATRDGSHANVSLDGRITHR